MRTILVGTISGLVGVAAGGLIAWQAARAWESMSDFWPFLGLILPILTIPLGCLLVAKMFPGASEWPVEHRGVVLTLAAVGSVLAAFGALVTHVIIVRTWHPHQIDPSLLGLLGDLLHPWTLPEMQNKEILAAGARWSGGWRRRSASPSGGSSRCACFGYCGNDGGAAVTPPLADGAGRGGAAAGLGGDEGGLAGAAMFSITFVRRRSLAVGRSCSSSMSPTISSSTSSRVISPKMWSSSSRTSAIGRFALRNSRSALSSDSSGLQVQGRVQRVLQHHHALQAEKIKQVLRVDDADDVIDAALVDRHARVGAGCAPPPGSSRAACAAPARPSSRAAPCSRGRACSTGGRRSARNRPGRSRARRPPRCPR